MLDCIDKAVVSDLLDKLTINQLFLMEEKMRCEMNIESSINNGCIHLAKSRYIMGQSSVSTARLPVENSPEFAASVVCEAKKEDGSQVIQLKASESNAENKVNPLRWFGVLVPQNLHKAQGIFQNAVNFVVECVNVQLQLLDNIKKIDILKTFLCKLEH